MTYIAAASRYEQIAYRRCGRSGLMLPEISLGPWQNFGDDRPADIQRAIIRRAFDLSVTVGEDEYPGQNDPTRRLR
jgi:L-glyceraldehyde 3-phosphate reductase